MSKESMQRKISMQVYGKPDCEFCDKAKELLDNLKIPYVYRDISVAGPDRTYILNQGHTKVPQIYAANGSLVGGYTELSRFLG